jgi:hypothetical protein
MSLLMIDGDNRGERYLAFPQTPSSQLRTLSRWSHTMWLVSCAPALASAAKSTQGIAAWSHTNKGLGAWGDVTFRYGSALLQSKIVHGNCWWDTKSANQNQRNLFHAAEQGVGHVCIGGRRATLRQQDVT